MSYRTTLVIGIVSLLMPAVASAHAVVSPYQASTQTYQDFSLSVPSEKDSPTIAVRLLMPAAVSKVTPVVKPGWKITMEKEGTTTIAITWTGGSIPAGQKDFFQFSVLTPATSTTLQWKAYQTYRDGTVIAWDQDGSKAPAGTKVYPYSTTDIRPDISTGAPQTSGNQSLAIVALALSAAALAHSLYRRRGDK